MQSSKALQKKMGFELILEESQGSLEAEVRNGENFRCGETSIEKAPDLGVL